MQQSLEDTSPEGAIQLSPALGKVGNRTESRSPHPAWNLRSVAALVTLDQRIPMVTLDEKIARTQRLLRRLEEDEPYLRARLSALGAEHRQSANAFADRVRMEAKAELQRLMAERGTRHDLTAPQPAD